MSINFNWVKSPNTNRGRGLATTEDIVVKKVKNGVDVHGVQQFKYTLTIPVTAMKMARFVIGDRVNVGFGYDPSKGNCLAIRRVVSGGHMLGVSSSNKKGQSKDSIGKILRSRIQFTDNIGPEYFDSANGGYDVDENGMLIAWDGKL